MYSSVTKSFLIFLASSFVLLSYTTDEDSFYDLTDLNMSHYFIFSLSILSCVVFDNIAKAIESGVVLVDYKLMLFAFVSVNGLLWYFMIIWLGFFIHVNPGMLTNLIEFCNY